MAESRGCLPSRSPLSPGPGGAYILMLHVFEQEQLAVGALGEDLRLEGPAQLLDGHLLPGPLVDGGAVGGTGRSACGSRFSSNSSWSRRGLQGHPYT